MTYYLIPAMTYPYLPIRLLLACVVLMLCFGPRLEAQPAQGDSVEVFLSGTTEAQINEFLDRLDQGDNVERLVITTRDVNFEVGSTELSPETADYLDYVVRLMERVGTINLRVVGHTDSTGRVSSNQTLSEGRAASVKTYLVRSGIADERIVTEGRGQLEPLASNKDEAGRAVNRRVELRIEKQAQIANVQDMIVLLDSTRIGAVILEEAASEIRYRSFRDNRERAVARSRVAYLVRSSGRIEWINRPVVAAPEPEVLPEPEPPTITQNVITTSRLSISFGQRQVGFDEISNLRVSAGGYAALVERPPVGQAFNWRVDYESEALGRSLSVGVFLDGFSTGEDATGLTLGLKVGYRALTFGPAALIPSVGIATGSARIDLPSTSRGIYGGEAYSSEVDVDLQTSYNSFRPEVGLLVQVLPTVQVRASVGAFVPLSDGSTRFLFQGEADGERTTSSVDLDGLESPWNYSGAYVDVGIGIGIRTW